jgi:hypothetical protein
MTKTKENKDQDGDREEPGAVLGGRRGFDCDAPTAAPSRTEEVS